MDGYVICATPRTGSTLLCEMLAATGRAGAPDSFFMRDPGREWVRAWGLPDRSGAGTRVHAAAYVGAAIAAGRGGTGLFGLRLMRAHLADLMAMIARVHPGLPSDRARLQAAFGSLCFIHLTRADKLAQAVSLVKARQTGLWHIAPDGTEIERLAPAGPPDYDAARIAATLAELERLDADWRGWFEAQGIAPLRIGYETLSHDPAATVARVLGALGLPPPGPGAAAPVARMADAVSADWIARFRSETGHND